MEALIGLFWLFVMLVLVGLPIGLLVWLLSLTSRIRYLESRAEELRRELALVRAVQGMKPDATAAPALAVQPRPSAAPPVPSFAPETAAPEPPSPPLTPPAPPPTPPPPVPSPPARVTPPAPAPPPPPRGIAAAPESEPEPARASAWSIEELIGGVWLQNVGSVLLLVAFFFLILWGYTTGRIGPGGLVAAGVALGGLFYWRGDRVSRSLPAFGHALVGIGLGVAYLSLYLGHFTLHVLPTLVAFALLTATSLVAVIAGQHYRVQTIAALGVLGAFVPQFAATLADLQGFEHQPPGLLGYLAFVNVAVFWLAARSSWSGLALTAVLLTAATWVVALQGRLWNTPVEVGLCALFVLLGLAPLRRWAERDEDAAMSDLALVTLAPYALVAASWPYFAQAAPTTTATILFALAGVYAAAAWWIDGRRERQDFWRALIAACVVFATAALERALDTKWTPMAWCVEAAALIALGVRPRAAWLRGLGYVVFAIGAATLIPAFLFGSVASPSTRLGEVFPLSALTADSIRCLVAIAAFAVAARALERSRESFGVVEGAWAPNLVHAAGQVFVALWLAIHAWNVAAVATSVDSSRIAIGQGLVALYWLVQAALLVTMGLRRGKPFRRKEGYLVAGASLFALTIAFNASFRSASEGIPFMRVPALLALLWIALAFAIARLLTGVRDRLDEDERMAPEFVTAVAHATLAGWFAVETTVFVRRLATDLAPALGLAMTAFLWAAQGAWLVVRGLRGRSLFRRGAGYVLLVVSALVVALAFVQSRGLSPAIVPYVHAAALLELAWIALVFGVAQLLVRSSDRLEGSDRDVAEVAKSTGHVGLVAFLGVETAHQARVLPAAAATVFAPSLTALLWVTQAAWLVLRGLRNARAFQRGLGYGIGALSVIAILRALLAATFQRPAETPFDPYALLQLAWIAIVFAIAHVLSRARERLGPSERFMPEGLSAVAHGALLWWSGLQTGAYARSLGPERGAVVGPALTSGAWLAQAAGAFAIGWMRRSSFLRWLGLGLFGLTVLKVTLFDLSRADTFVRAVIAVAVGTVLLVVSYVYQRARKNRSTEAPPRPTLSEP